MKKTVLFGLLVILLAFGLISCVTQTNIENDSIHAITTSIPHSNEIITHSVRHDGVYYCKESDYTSYIRFYDDGIVITVSSTGAIAQIKRWFNKDNDNISIGKFNIISDKISFSSTNSDGTVDYNGQILNDKLLLNIYSHINGYVSNNNEYLFSTW